jgi:hypothetical protein
LSHQRKLKLGFLGLLLLGFVVWAYYPTWWTSGVPLTFKIEGALDSKLNLRDAGASINECLGTTVLPLDKVWRASGFFSGWGCDRVGNPDVIYSLNYSEDENRRYYCRGSDGFRIGRTFQRENLSDLEFLDTWNSKKTMADATCSFIGDALNELQQGKRLLIHCEAGRDRTGAVTALLAGLLLEDDGNLSDAEIKAIECDYRKSASLNPSKYGRIESLLRELRQMGGVRRFIAERCGLEQGN